MKKRMDKASTVIDSLDMNKALNESSTCLEFLLLSFCKQFELRPKQAAGLLTQGGKYLAHIISKGLKGKHEPIVSWYQAIYGNLRHLALLIADEESKGSLSLILSALKSGFVGKHIETVLWCCRVYSKLAEDLADNDLLPSAWEWFVSEGGGIEGTLLACKRFGPDIKSAVISVYVQFAKTHFYELFSMHLRKLIPEMIQYITIMDEFLPCLCAIRTAKHELITSGLAEFWIDLALKEAAQDKRIAPDIKLAAVNFVCDIWIHLPSLIENNDEIGGYIMTTLKRACRDRHKLLKSLCHAKLFQLLELFSSERNSYAPVVYKTLTFSLVENYEDFFVRDFLLNCFVSVFRNIESIPVGIVIEPLIKQLQVTTKINLNISEFDLFTVIGRHPRLGTKNAVQLLDILLKFYANDYKYANAAFIPIMIIAERFIGDPLAEEFFYRTTHYGLRLTHDYAFKKVADKNLLIQRDLMLKLIESVIQLRHDSLNERIKIDILKANQSLRREKGLDYKPLQILLAHFGDVSQLIAHYDSVPQESFRGGDRTPNIKVQKKQRALKPQVELRQKKLPKFELRDFTSEEQNSLQALLKKYQRALKLLFRKYSNSGYKENTGRGGFDRLSNYKETLSVSELYKLLKDQGVTSSMASLEDVSSIIKTFCHQSQKGEHTVNFREFNDLLPQFALFIYSKPPKDLSHLAPAVSLRSLFDLFKSKSLNRRFFDEPDPGFGDRDVVKHINKQLERNPSLPIPEGYKKVVDKDIVMRYQVPEIFKIPETTAIALEIVDEMLCKMFGFHILEPSVTYKEVYRVKGVIPGLKKQELSPSLKHEITRLSRKYKEQHLNECAWSLEDILAKVENSLNTNNKEKAGRVENSILKQRKEKQEEEEKAALQREKRRRLRKQIVEEKLRHQREQKELQLKEQQEQERLREERVIDKKRRIEEKKEQERRKLKEDLEQWKYNKEKEEINQQQRLEEEKAKEEYAKRAKVDEFLRREQEKISSLLKETKEKKLMSEHLKEQKLKDEELAIKARRAKVSKKLIHAKQVQEEEKELNDKIKEKIESGELNTVLNEFHDSLRTVFLYYKGFNKERVVDQEFIDLGSYQKFISQFNIWPGLMRSEEATRIFMLITKRKPGRISVDYNEFLEVLVRLGLSAKDFLEATQKKTVNSTETALRALFEWLRITSNRKNTIKLLKERSSNLEKVNTAQKRSVGHDLDQILLKKAVAARAAAPKSAKNSKAKINLSVNKSDRNSKSKLKKLNLSVDKISAPKDKLTKLSDQAALINNNPKNSKAKVKETKNSRSNSPSRKTNRK